MAGELNYTINLTGNALKKAQELEHALKNIDISFSKAEKKGGDSMKKTATDVSSLIRTLKALEIEYLRIKKLEDSTSKTRELNNLKGQYALITAELKKYGDAVGNVAEQQRKAASTANFKESIAGLTKQSQQIKDLNKYYKDLEQSSKAAGIAQEKAAKAAAKEQEKYNSIQAQLSRKSTQDVIAFQPKNIQQTDAAIKELTKRRRELDNTDKAYYETLGKVNQRQAELIKQNLRAANAGLRLKDSTSQATSAFKSQNAVVNELMQRAGMVFSLYQAERFFQQMIKIRGEFELQGVALGAMLQNKKLADEMFAKVQQMAMQSPFSILELNKYLKQIKAYRIENEELIPTLKMLGDVSAGLGVSMDRLILAYGQVKAASVLRGTELRQFTEAGIPLVEELADKFTKLKGRVVSVAEVFDMISKRQVSFEAVKDIFEDMTKQGGIFYNQQIIQSQTLAGKVSNLGDAYDKFLNNIGKQQSGFWKSAIDSGIKLIDNYEQVGIALQGLIATYASYKIAVTALNIANLVKEYNSLKGALVGTANAQRMLNLVALKNPYFLAAAAIATVVTGIRMIVKSKEQEEKAFRDSLKPISENIDKLRELKVQYEKTNQSGIARADVISKINKEYPELLKNLSEEAKRTGKVVDAIEEQIKLSEQLAVFRSFENRNIKYLEKKDDYDKASAVFEEKRIDMESRFGEIKQAMLQFQSDISDNSIFKAILESEATDIEKIEKLYLSYGFRLEEIEKQKGRATGSEWKALETERKAILSILKEFKGDGWFKSAMGDFEEAKAEMIKFQNLMEFAATQIKIDAEKQAKERYPDDLKQQKEYVDMIMKYYQLANDALVDQTAKVNDEWFEMTRNNIKSVKKAIEEGKSYSFIPSGDTKYFDMVEELPKRYEEIMDKLSTLKSKNVDIESQLALTGQFRSDEEKATYYSLLKQKKALQEELVVLKDVAKYWLIQLETPKAGNKSLTKVFEDRLSYLEEVRQFFLSMQDATKDTAFADTNLIDESIRRIFTDENYKEAISNYTDGAYKILLSEIKSSAEKLLLKASSEAKPAIEAFVASLNDKITDIAENIELDEAKLNAEAEKLRNQLLGAFAPFGEGFVFDITVETSKAENAIIKLQKDRKAAYRGANAEQKAALDELYRRERELILKNQDERIKGIVEEGIKTQLGNLEQFYTNVNDATFKQILMVDEKMNQIADKKVTPMKLITPEQLNDLGLATDKLETLLEVMNSGNEVSIAIMAETLGLTEDQVKQLEGVVRASKAQNAELEKLVGQWRELSRIEKIEKIKDAADTASDSMSKLADSFSELADAMGDAKLSEELSGISAAISGLGDAFSIGASIATLDIKGAIDSATNLINREIQDITRRVQEAKDMQDEWNKSVRDTAQSYALLQIESQLSMGESSDIFGTESQLKNAQEAFKAYGMARSELKKLGNELESGKIQTGVKEDKRAKFSGASLISPLGIVYDIWKGKKYPEVEKIFTGLKEQFGEIYNSETFELNPAIIAGYGQLDDQTKALVDDWGEIKAKMEETEQQMMDVLESMVGGIGKSLSDSIVEAFINGTDAAEVWGENVEGIIEDMLETMLRATYLQPIFDDLKTKITSTAKGGGSEYDLSKIIAETFSSNDIPSAIAAFTEAMPLLQDEFKKFGLNLWEAEDSAKGLTKGIQGVTEDEANIIAAYLNTIRHHVVLNTGYLEQLLAGFNNVQGIMSQQLMRLAAIEANTEKTANILDKVTKGQSKLYVA